MCRWLGCLGVVVGSVVTTLGAEVDPPVPVVLSTDVGNEIDDQWAIVYLLLQPKFEVLGVMSAARANNYCARWQNVLPYSGRRS